MPGISYNRARRVVARQLKRFGKLDAVQALLIRGNVTRPCLAARLEFRPEQRELHEVGTSRILIAANSVDIPPHHDFDMIHYAGANYRIVEPIKGLHQSEETRYYYDCVVSYQQKVSYLHPIENIGAISIGLGFDVEPDHIEIVHEIQGASFGLGFDMYPIPIAQATNFIEGASFNFGFDMESVPELTNYIGPASFGFGFDMEPTISTVGANYITGASFSLGFDMEPIAQGTNYIEGASFGLGFDVAGAVEAQLINYIEVAFDMGFDMASIPELTQFIPAVNFGMGFGIDNAVVTSIPNTPVDDGDATATIDDTTPVTGQTINCVFADNDPDGAATGITYQWFHDTSNLITGATSASYTVPQFLLGSTLRCRVNYTDGEGYSESIFTADTSAIAQGNQVSAWTFSNADNNSSNNSGTTLNLGPGAIPANRIVVVLVEAVHASLTQGVTSITVPGGGTMTLIEQMSTTWSQVTTKRGVIQLYAIHSGAGIAAGSWVANMAAGYSIHLMMATLAGGLRTIMAPDTVTPGGAFEGLANQSTRNSASAAVCSYTRGGLASSKPFLIAGLVAPQVQSGIADHASGGSFTSIIDVAQAAGQQVAQRWDPGSSGNKTVAFSGSSREFFSACFALSSFPP